MLSTDLLSKAIEECGRESFEKFCHVFAAAAGYGVFIPLGGIHDGGADGYFEVDLKNNSFVQITKQAATVSKINSTIDRLVEVGRDVKKLTYFTSQIVPFSDKIRENVFDKRGVLVEIRDRPFLSSSVNQYPAAIQAARELLLPSLDYLKEILSNENAPQNVLQNHRELAVYLTQEIERRRDNSALPESVTDSLILWALEGTDPDKNILMNRNEILARIVSALPTAKSMIYSRIDHRLKTLAKKGNSSGREINWHKKEDSYCLPYSTRSQIEEENIIDAEIK